MAPVRTAKSHLATSSSSGHRQPDQARSAKFKNKASRSTSESETAAPPGVQKLKGSLRQTRRLLAKDNIAADVRVSTERRLKALESDLARALVARKERAIAVRYHKIKFFERQKITRKIKQLKKQLAEAPETDARARKELMSRLEEQRVDLNYVLHYPKTRRYISLFPPEVREGKSPQQNAEREEIRDWMRGKMQAGEINAEPEVIGKTPIERGSGPSTASWETSRRTKAGTVSPAAHGDGRAAREDDDFFGEDDEDASDQSMISDDGDIDCLSEQ